MFRRRAIKRGGLILGSAWLFWLVLGFVSGPLLKDTVARLLSEKLLRPVSISRLALNPFTLRFEAEGFRIASLPGQGDKPIVALDRLLIDLSASSFARFKPVVDDLDLERPEINLVRLDGERTNISDIIEALRSPPDEEKTPTPKFELRDLHIRGGRITLEDRVAGTTTDLAALELALPRLANLGQGDDRAVPVLKGTVDGAPFEFKAEAVPFASVPEATMRLAFTGLDPLPLLRYAALPAVVDKARLDLDVNARLHLEADKPIGLALSGEVVLRDFAVRQQSGAPLVEGQRLAVSLDKVEPFAGAARIAGIRLEKTQFHVGRDAQGKINWQSLAEPSPQQASGPAAPAKPSQAQAAPAKGDDGFKWSVAKVELADLSVTVDDNFQGPPRHLAVNDLQISLRDISAGFAKPILFDISAAIQVGDWARLESLSLNGGQLDLAGHGVSIEKAALDGAKVALQRDRDGRLAIPLPFVAETPAAATAAKPSRRTGAAKPGVGPKAASATADAGPAWHAQVAQVAVNGVTVEVEDKSVPQPLQLKFSDMSVALAGVDTAPGKAMTVKFGTTVTPLGSALADGQGGRSSRHGARIPAKPGRDVAKSGSGKAAGKAAKALARGGDKAATPGRLEVEGQVTLAPLNLALTIQTRQLSLQPAQAYLADKVGFRLARGQLSGALKVALAEPRTKGAGQAGALTGRVSGDMTVGDLSAEEAASGNEFLHWKSLYFGGLDVKVPVTDVAVREVALSDFAANIEVSPQGELNLKQLMKPAGAAAAAPEQKTTEQKTAASPTGSPAAAAPTSDGPRIKVGKVTLQGGRVFVTDHFVKPNYSTRLVDLGGRIGSLSTDPAVRSDFDIRGRLGIGTPVVISGKVNPLAQNPYLDLKMEAKGIEMTTFSPYSGKYLGYTIEKGKLLVDVSYLVENRQLKAENHVFLDQFTLGEPVDSADAVKLPVRLAISLLTNNRGEIDLRLPVSGSLDDPQFSVGGVIWQIIKNIITKAVTAPFSLLAKAFGSSDDLEQLAFAPGRATLDDGLRGKLDTLVKVLNDRTSLKVEIAGIALPEAEADDYRRAQLELKVRQRKRSAADPDAESVTVSPDEYPKLLERVYKDANFPKPRNFIGLTKSLPVEEMERLLLANTPAGDQELRQLAERRAKAVEDYLIQKGIAQERLFLVTPKLEQGGGEAVPRVALSLR